MHGMKKNMKFFLPQIAQITQTCLPAGQYITVISEKEICEIGEICGRKKSD
jgi:hypothetical protein